MCDITAAPKNEFGCKLGSAIITARSSRSGPKDHHILTLLSWVIGLPVLAIAAFFLVGPDRVWQTFTGPADMGVMNLVTLVRTGKPNDALIGRASALPLPPDAESPVIALPAQELFRHLIAQIDAADSVTWVEQNDEQL